MREKGTQDKESLEKLKILKNTLGREDYEILISEPKIKGSYMDNLINTSLGKELGSLTFSINPINKGIYVGELYVNEEERGKCVAKYIFRDFINIVDSFCAEAEIEAQPFGYEKLEFEERKEKIQNLVNFYGSFGFVPKGSLKKWDRKQLGQPMIRKRRC